METPNSRLARAASGVWSILVRHRSTIIALAFAAVGVTLMIVAQTISAQGVFDDLLRSLTANGVAADEAVRQLNQLSGNGAWTTILWSIGGTLLSIGVVTVAWETFVQLSWVSLMRDEIVRALIDPSIFKELKRRSHESMLGRLLENFHGPEVGDAMFRESKAITQGSTSMRSDFNYSITLGVHQPDLRFHTANFHVSFVVASMRKLNTISFARLSDSLEFHSRYEGLVKSEPDTILP